MTLLKSTCPQEWQESEDEIPLSPTHSHMLGMLPSGTAKKSLVGWEMKGRQEDVHSLIDGQTLSLES